MIWLQLDYRRELASNTRRFGDFFQYSRGYQVNRNDSIYENMDWVYRIGINYQLPIAYPDFGFGGIIYFKRVRTNLFADISQLGFKTGNIPMNSVGVELLFDIELLNIESFSFGLRWSHRLQADPANPNDPSRNRFGVFVPVNRI